MGDARNTYIVLGWILFNSIVNTSIDTQTLVKYTHLYWVFNNLIPDSFLQL